MSHKLTRDRYEAGVAFVRKTARPLDVALLDHALGTADPEPALLALSEFQNPDGGFGGGLECDTQAAASTAIATSVALRLLLRLGAPARHPMVAGSMRWLAETLDRDSGVWWIVGPEVNDAPHAPWWHWSADAIGSETLAGAKTGFVFNPSAELLGQLYAFGAAKAGDAASIAESRLRREIAALDVIESAYDLKCVIRLADTAAASPDLVAALDPLIRRSLTARDMADEHGPALDFAPTPASRYADAIADHVDGAIQALVANQADDGGWKIFWDWSFVDAKAWTKVERDWRGCATREALEALQAWGRIEGP